MKQVLVIDNYDSFVYNLAQLLGQMDTLPIVFRNDKITIEEIEKMSPSGIVISPGPGHPADKRSFGICNEVITIIGPKIPILGVCLGNQGIAYSYGGKVINAKHVRHGKTSTIKHYGGLLFYDLRNPFIATRYHSLVADPKTVPSCLEITATSIDDGEIMGLQHKRYPIYGVQFHPESVLTKDGSKILLNFIHLLKR
ncbi:MAG TPA: aminodeoxychorismate/anthranilate synthase component II [Nitrososphaeraceae archaeon]